MKKNLLGREYACGLFVVIGILTIISNQVVNVQNGEFNWSAVFFRSEVWFALSIGLAGIIAPKQLLTLHLPWKRKVNVILQSQFLFLFFCILATLMTGLLGGAMFDYFGAMSAMTILVSGFLGILVFNLAMKSDQFIDTMSWTFAVLPLISLSSFIFGMGLENESNDQRFRGFSSNPNIIAIQSMVALGIFIPKLFQINIGRPIFSIFITSSVVIVLTVALLTGTRAALVVLVLLISSVILLHFRLKSSVDISSFLWGLLSFTILFVFFWAVFNTGIFDIIIYRANEGGDIRIQLWEFYSSKIFERPWGFGFGFESVIDVNNIFPPLRLPPHNFLLLSGIYGGIAGMVVVTYIIFRIMRLIISIRHRFHEDTSNRIESLALAWIANIGNMIFGGTFFGDYVNSMLMSLLLASVIRANVAGRINILTRR